MGNCFGLLRRPVLWVDDHDDDEDEDFEFFKNSYDQKQYEVKDEKISTTEVKIKITKKQLEELLRQVKSKKLPIQKVLEDLVSNGELCHQPREQTWKPMLQSIPEVGEYNY